MRENKTNLNNHPNLNELNGGRLLEKKLNLLIEKAYKKGKISKKPLSC